MNLKEINDMVGSKAESFADWFAGLFMKYLALIVLVALIGVGIGLGAEFWRRFQESQGETRCPRCGRAYDAEARSP